VEDEVTFRAVPVFDVSQTEGAPLPSLGPGELIGGVDGYEALTAALTSASPVPIAFARIPGGAKGYYDSSAGSIAIQEGMSELQTLKTLVHEIAHSRLHGPGSEGEGRDHATREVEAESVAYTVLQRYGLDSSEYSFTYIAAWSGGRDVVALKASLDRIRDEADAIIRTADEHLAARGAAGASAPPNSIV